MGAISHDTQAFSWEKPTHQVTLTKDFFLSEQLVTQGLYESVMGMNPSYFKGVDHPVECVSWYVL